MPKRRLSSGYYYIKTPLSPFTTRHRLRTLRQSRKHSRRKAQVAPTPNQDQPQPQPPHQKEEEKQETTMMTVAATVDALTTLEPDVPDLSEHELEAKAVLVANLTGRHPEWRTCANCGRSGMLRDALGHIPHDMEKRMHCVGITTPRHPLEFVQRHLTPETKMTGVELMILRGTDREMHMQIDVLMCYACYYSLCLIHNYRSDYLTKARFGPMTTSLGHRVWTAWWQLHPAERQMIGSPWLHPWLSLSAKERQENSLYTHTNRYDPENLFQQSFPPTLTKAAMQRWLARRLTIKLRMRKWRRWRLTTIFLDTWPEFPTELIDIIVQGYYNGDQGEPRQRLFLPTSASASDMDSESDHDNDNDMQTE